MYFNRLLVIFSMLISTTQILAQVNSGNVLILYFDTGRPESIEKKNRITPPCQKAYSFFRENPDINEKNFCLRKEKGKFAVQGMGCTLNYRQWSLSHPLGESLKISIKFKLIQNQDDKIAAARSLGLDENVYSICYEGRRREN